MLVYCPATFKCYQRKTSFVRKRHTFTRCPCCNGNAYLCRTGTNRDEPSQHVHGKAPLFSLFACHFSTVHHSWIFYLWPPSLLPHCSISTCNPPLFITFTVTFYYLSLNDSSLCIYSPKIYPFPVQSALPEPFLITSFHIQAKTLSSVTSQNQAQQSDHRGFRPQIFCHPAEGSDGWHHGREYR